MLSLRTSTCCLNFDLYVLVAEGKIIQNVYINGLDAFRLMVS